MLSPSRDDILTEIALEPVLEPILPGPVQKERGYATMRNPVVLCGGPSGVRTRVFAVRGRCPGPLDDGTIWLRSQDSNLENLVQSQA